jgi:hypothetical protein
MELMSIVHRNIVAVLQAYHFLVAVVIFIISNSKHSLEQVTSHPVPNGLQLCSNILESVLHLADRLHRLSTWILLDHG